MIMIYYLSVNPSTFSSDIDKHFARNGTIMFMLLAEINEVNLSHYPITRKYILSKPK